MTALAAAETPSRASTVQKVVSKGGVEAWLVEDYAIPLIALEFAFKGGAAAGSDRQARRRHASFGSPRRRGWSL